VCRTTGSPCNANLGCNSTGTCVPLVADGMPCDATGATNLCATPDICVTNGGTSTCRNVHYTESLVANDAFIDACGTGGTHVMMLVPRFMGGNERDDGHSAMPVTIPFNFTFYGAAQGAIWPSTNGYAIFSAMNPPSDATGTADMIPTANETSPAVFPMWEDLVLRAAPGSDICYITSGTAPNRKFVVEWKDAENFLATAPDMSHLTFEVVLSETTNTLDFIYSVLMAAPGDETRVNGATANIGLQAAGGAAFIVHTGTVTVANGVRYTP
jgi:hypothetical protein